MKRREFVTLLGGAAAWPVAARAQQPAMPVVGYLGTGSPAAETPFVAGFVQGLKESGYVDGQNAAIEYRWAEGQYDRLPALAADLVRRQVTVIAAPGSVPSALAAKAATSTIPIIFSGAVDPVTAGLVASLNRPGGNVTGVTSLNVEVGPKRLELMHELAPTATIIALLVNPTNPNVETLSRDAQAAAHTLGLHLHVLHASTERDIDRDFAMIAQLRAGALVTGPDPFLLSRKEQLAALALSRAVPSISPFREFVAAGGLMSYGGSLTEMYHLAGVYAGRILRGEKPADLPVQQPTKFELVINLKTAKALDIEVPISMQLLADEVIE